MSLRHPSSWQLTLASVIGQSHLQESLPNQDHACALQHEAANVVAAAVADGAGSAPRSLQGATLTADRFAQALLELSRSPRLAGMDAQALHDWAVARLEAVRQQLLATGAPLQHFHCTLVACVLSPGGCWLFQLGDSAAISSRCAWNGGVERVWFPPESTQLHAGSRGEYANETHFVTDPDWSAHLTVLPIAADHDAVLLMTDGAMDLAVVRGEVFPRFLPVAVPQLVTISERSDRDTRLAAWLADPQTHRVTGDDKTLLMILRVDCGAAPQPGADLPLAQLSPPPAPLSTPPAPPAKPGPRPGSPVVPAGLPEPMPDEPPPTPPEVIHEPPLSLWPDWRWWAVLAGTLILLIGPLIYVMLDRVVLFAEPAPAPKAPPSAPVGARFEGGDRMVLNQGSSARVRVVVAKGNRVEIEQSPSDLDLPTADDPCLKPVPRDSQTVVCEFLVTAGTETPAGPRLLRLRVRNAGSPQEQRLVLTLLVQDVVVP